jgi:prepilin-type N-terminal cleavage/methylation domain-containing protein
MKKSALLLNLIQHLAQKKAVLNRSPIKENAGYTLIELLVVIVMIAVLATIAAPSWLTFINQRRVNAANEFVFRALQEAQSLAKNKKLSYSVSFRTQDNIPEVAIYPQGSTPGEAQWRSLGKNLSIKPGQILLGTNLQSDNKKQGSIDYNLQPDETITFDYLGALYTGTTTTPDPDLTIVVAANKGGGAATSTMRCVKVKTLLGALTTGKGADCGV